MAAAMLLRLLLALALLLPAARAFADSSGADGLRAESDHFVLYSDAAVDGAGILRDLERFRRAVIADLQLSDTRSPDKLTLSIIDDTQAFEALTPGGITAAIYLHSAAGEDIVIGYSDDPDHLLHRALEADWLRLVLRHEVVHHIVEQGYSRKLPIWLGEGMADYYATYDHDGESLAVFGRALPDEDELSRAGSWLPMRTVIESMARYPDYAAATTDSLFRAQRLYYGQSWALAHFVMTEPEGLANIHRFVDDWDVATDSEDSFERAFGLRYGPLEDRVRGRLGQPGGSLRVRDVGTAPAGPVSSEAASEAQLSKNLQRLLLSYGRAGALVDGADMSVTGEPSALLARALRSWRQGDWDGVDLYTDRVLAVRPGDARALKLRAKAAYGRLAQDQMNDALWKGAEAAAVLALGVSPQDAQLHLFRVAVSLPEGDRLPTPALASLDWLVRNDSHLRHPHEAMMMIPALLYEGRLDHADAVLDSAARWSDNPSDSIVIERFRSDIATRRVEARLRAP